MINLFNALLAMHVKKIDNYIVGKDSYIYNIVNRYDDLCFLRYFILVKYPCNVERKEYLNYEKRFL